MFRKLMSNRLFTTMIIISLGLLSAVSVENMRISGKRSAAQADAQTSAATEELKSKLLSYGLPLHPALYWKADHE